MVMTTAEHDSSRCLVGIVVVSHSRALARAAVALAAEMLHGRPVPIAVAAGLDEVTLGTDAVRIKEAIQEVDSPAGVVVLMDLGSAVLSAELALDLIDDPKVRERVVLSAAPLIEGLIVAAVAAAGGAGRKEVAAEAHSALMGKDAQLSNPEDTSPPTPVAGDSADVVAVFTIANRHGLHARPAARLVSEMRGLDASVRLRNLTTGTAPVPAASLSRVATLAALHGHQVEISASGPQAPEAIDHLLALAARNFDEPLDDAPTPVQVQNAGPLPASPGIRIGPVLIRSISRRTAATASTIRRHSAVGVPVGPRSSGAAGERSIRTGPIRMPGDAGNGPACCTWTGVGASSTGSSKLRAARASRWSIASGACGPDAEIST